LFADQAVFGAKTGAAIDLRRATIDGSVNFFRSAFCPSGSPSVEGEGVKIGQFLSFERSRVRGSVRIAHASIGANLIDPAWVNLNYAA
jgi:hypothetical protein